MGAKFPLLAKLIYSDLYRTLVAVCLVFAMVWSLNDPQRGGWVVLAAFIGWTLFRSLRKARMQLHPILLLGLIYGIYLMIPKADETAIPMYAFATAIFWMVLAYTWMIFDSDDGYLTKANWENALILLAVIAVGQTLYEAAIWYRDYLLWQSTLTFEAPGIAYRASGSFTAHPNNLAGLLNAVWPLVLLRLLQTRRIYARLAAIVCLGFIFLTLVLANSRGGILGTAAMLAFLGVSALLFRYPGILNRPAELWRSIQRRDKLLGGAFLLAGILLVGFIFWRAAFTGAQASVFNSRNIIWVYSWQAFMHSPWIGSGAGSFVQQYAQAAGLPPGFVAPHAHNLELQALVISGVFGLLFLLGALLLMVYTFFKTIQTLDGADRIHFVLLSSIPLGVLVHNQFDYILEGSPANMTTFLVVLAVWLSFNRAPQKSWAWRVWLPAAALVGLSLLLPVVRLNRLFEGQARYEASIALSKQGQWEQAYPIVCDLAAAPTSNQFYAFQCSLLKSLAGYTAHDQSLIADALAVEQSALAANPWWPVNRANYAGLLWNAGQYEAAFQEMRTAAQGVSRNATIFLNFAAMAERIGENSTAIAAYRLAMLNDPYQIGEELNESSAAWNEARTQIGSLVSELDTWDEFRAAVQETSFTTQREWSIWRGVAASQLGNFELAQEMLHGQLSLNPDGIGENAHYAQSLSENGNLEEAEKYAEILHFAAQRQLISVGFANTGWFPFYVAGHIYRQNDHLVEARESLTTAFQILNQESSSASYNLHVYRNFAPLWDLSPTLEWGQLTSENAADFHWLADELRQSGEIELGDQIRDWLELQERPKLEIIP